MDSANLKCTVNGSNKFYQCGIEAKGDGFIVAYAHGPIGGTPQTGVHKDTRLAPVSYAKAKQVFERLVKSKLDKDYVYASGNGMVIVGNSEGKIQSGIRPQLLNPVDEENLEQLFRDNQFMMQEKKDGQRRLVKKSGDEVFGINRKGLIVALPEPIVLEMKKLPGKMILDGEQIGTTLWAFDTLEADGENLKDHTAEERYFTTLGLVAVCGAPLQAVKTAFSETDKRALFDNVRQYKGEGVVFKLRHAAYVPGKPASGGSQLKFKFVQTASCQVYGLNSKKRSVQLAVYTHGTAVEIGNVTIPANHAMPLVGAIVEVRYLYAFPGGSLFQPQYLGERSDHDADELDTLKFKPAESDDDEL